MIETERLILRPFEPGDLDAFAAINADAEVMRHFAAMPDRAGTATLMERLAERRADAGFGMSAAVERESGRFLGMIGIQTVPFEQAFTPAVEVGWRLRRDAWGHGYATEGARAAMAEGFTRFGLHEIVAFTLPVNLRSRAVMERLGMTSDPNDDFDHPLLAEDHPMRRHVLYRVARTTFPA